MSRLWLVSLAAVLFAPSLDATYRGDVEEWRRQREAKLRADDGWLTVVGLAWLKPGETRIGADPDNDVVLPAGAPPVLGVLRLNGDSAEFQAEPGLKVTCDGKPFPRGVIRSDADEKPDVLAIGDIRLILLKRGVRYALRIKDNQSPLRTGFAGLRWYPIKDDWKVSAKFVAQPNGTKITMDTIIGEPITLGSPGHVIFERDGKEYRLQAASEGEKLWFVFRDATSGKTTHPGARQLTTELPKDGVVTLDFNKAINLPCAFTAHATCPLAAPGNRLKLAIDAGEMKYDARPIAAAAAR